MSADTPATLREEAAAILAYVSDRPKLGPDRVADMLLRTRVARRYRALLMVNDRAELDAALTAVRDGYDHPAVVAGAEPAAARRLAYVLPGQGTQRPGMGTLFYDLVPAFRAEADRCDAIFRDLFGESPLPYLLDPDAEADDNAQIVQPALFVQMVALGAMWRSVGVEAQATVGHSQGEIAAAYLSGAMSLADAIVVVGTRARAVDKIASDRYAMAVVAADRDECEEVLARESGWAQVSVVNSPRQVGISGDRDTVQSVVDVLAERGRFARVIKVRYPAHTHLLNEFRDVIRDAVHSRLENERFLDSEIDCLGATLGDAITADLPVDEYWFWNLRNPVRFDRAVAAAVAREVDTFVELAEHPTLQLAVEESLATFASDRATLVSGTSSRTATDLRVFTRNLAVLAVNDLNYRWDSLRVESDAPVPLPLLDFPNVRMNEMTLWLAHDVHRGNAGARANGAARAQAAPVRPEPVEVVRTGPAPRLLVENWARLVRRSMTAPRALGIVDHTGESAELAAALVEYATNQGLGGRLLDTEAGIGDGGIDTVVVLLPAMPEVDVTAAIAETAAFFGARRWLFKPEAAVTEYWLLTVGGEAVVPEDASPNPVHAAVAAGFRSAGAEYPGVAFRHLDLAPGQSDAAAVTSIITALHTADEPELALREGNLYAKRLVEADRSDSIGPVTAENVVITGGTGSLGLEFCEHAVRSGARRVTLVSRSGETEAVAGRLRTLRALGSAEIGVVACDIGDSASVALLADRLRDTPAQLVIHAAADNSAIGELELTEITHGQVGQALSGKVAGIANVLDAVNLSADCRIVLCSSLAATLGGRGTVVYAAANRMVDAFARQRRDDGLDCVSVQWGQWSVFEGRGNGDIARLAEVGYLPMASADAIALGLGGLPGNAVVAAFDWDRGRTVFGAFGYGPLLSGLQTPVVAAAPAPALTAAAPAAVGGDVSARVTRLLAEIIGADDIDTIDATKPLVAIGLDSLQALELRRRVKSAFGTDLPVADLIGGASLADVVRLVDTEHGGAAPEAVEAVVAPLTRSAPVVETLPSGAVLSATERIARAKLAAQHAVPSDFDAQRFASARADIDLYGLGAMLAAVRPALSDSEIRTVDDIAERMEFAPRHRWLLRQWLQALGAHGSVDGDVDNGFRFVRAVRSPIRPDLVEVCADLGYSRPLATFLQASDDHLTELAADTMRLQELLFPNGDMTTAEAAYRDNLSSRYLNLAAGRAVADLVDGLRGDRSPVRVLELGAGIGGTTDDVTAALSGLPVEYHFTDVSTFFLEAAKARFADYPWMRYGLVDMNADLAKQPRYDIVIAANVLHNAFDIGVTLGQLHDLLNPGGAVVIIETCHAHCEQLTSVHFLMSPAQDQPHAGLADVRAGTDRIFLTEQEWREQLVAAGLHPELVLPEGDHPVALLDQRVFIGVRGRGE
ncbi:nocobactin polyketide synthase NbtC [Nocardia sp. NBC_01377]|uniref:nocobactin polyketide synthase NbtC n=1 Tax=Nocardia sp. NBC_01377 TaxID=2903595 RepID=UPI003253333C